MSWPCGDATDNIPGVPGIGDKGARIRSAGSGDLDTLLREADSIENRRYREPLQQHADAARLSRELATIRRDAPVAFDPEMFRVHPPTCEAARRLFYELEFTAFLRDLPAPAVTHDVRRRSSSRRRRSGPRSITWCGATGVVLVSWSGTTPEPARCRTRG
mgnify:CR=1 FL=1